MLKFMYHFKPRSMRLYTAFVDISKLKKPRKMLVLLHKLYMF